MPGCAQVTSWPAQKKACKQAAIRRAVVIQALTARAQASCASAPEVMSAKQMDVVEKLKDQKQAELMASSVRQVLNNH